MAVDCHSVLLYLIRHGDAGDRDLLKWPDDRERPLTPKGKQRFEKAAPALRRIAADVDVLLSSRLVRAWQTAEIASKRGGWPAPVQCPALEPAGTSVEVVDALTPYLNTAGIALVGHEPNLSLLASHLVTNNEMITPFAFAKGGMACIAFGEAPRAGAGRLRWFLSPKLARALA